MTIRPYLPSATFSLIVGAVALSAGLVYAAELITRPPSPPAFVTAGGLIAADDTAWRAELLSLTGSTTPPTAVGDVSSLLAQAQTQNLTDSVGRSLLLKLSAAQGQGMANDESTQENIVLSALSQISNVSSQAYAAADFSLVADSPESLRSYGNGVMRAIGAHELASYQSVAVALGRIVDTNDASQSAVLSAAAGDYRALAKDLAALKVPESFAALHLSMVNTFAAEGGACADMAVLLSDPLRGLSGFQKYQALTAENLRVFTSLNTAFANNGILFTKDEPGYSWNLLRSGSTP